jgi:tRNA dimethylallyltransferase
MIAPSSPSSNPSANFKGRADRKKSALFLFPARKTPQRSDIESAPSKVLYLAGPTGVGKTALAVALAEELDAEIVGADAFQIYAGLPLLTAQPTPEERRRVPHHLVGCVPVGEAFDAQRYASTARGILADVQARGRVPLVVGGTGLYFRALIDGLAPTPPPNAALREELNALALPDLIARLHAADPDAPAQVDLQNKRRVTRAIEIVEGSGRPLAEFRTTARLSAPGLLLVRDRAELQGRIEANVRTMFDRGVIEEVAAFQDPQSKIQSRRVPETAAGNPRSKIPLGPTAARAIGLREIQALLRGELTRAACEEAIVIATRQYAKRQLTWFRHQTRFQALDLTGSPHPSLAVESALRVLREPDVS